MGCLLRAQGTRSSDPNVGAASRAIRHDLKILKMEVPVERLAEIAVDQLVAGTSVTIEALGRDQAVAIYWAIVNCARHREIDVGRNTWEVWLGSVHAHDDPKIVVTEAAVLEPQRSRVEHRAPEDKSVAEARRRQTVGRYSWVTNTIEGDWRIAVGLLDCTGEPGSSSEDEEDFRPIVLCRDQHDANVLLAVIQALDARTPDYLPSLSQDFEA